MITYEVTMISVLGMYFGHNLLTVYKDGEKVYRCIWGIHGKHRAHAMGYAMMLGCSVEQAREIAWAQPGRKW